MKSVAYHSVDGPAPLRNVKCIQAGERLEQSENIEYTEVVKLL